MEFCCNNCQTVYAEELGVCPFCGHEPPPEVVADNSRPPYKPIEFKQATPGSMRRVLDSAGKGTVSGMLFNTLLKTTMPQTYREATQTEGESQT